MFDTARICVELGCLPDAGGLNDQDPDLLDAIDTVRVEGLKAHNDRIKSARLAQKGRRRGR